MCNEYIVLKNTDTVNVNIQTIMPPATWALQL